MMRHVTFTALVISIVFQIIFISSYCECYEDTRGNRVTAEEILGAGQVRAAVVQSEAQLIGGPKSEGRVGDFKLCNSRVGFIISGIRPASGFDPLGGKVEDAGVLKDGPDGPRWHNIMGDAFPYFSRRGDPLLDSRLFAPVKAEVLKDGADGEAVVRFYGRDADFPIREERVHLPAGPLKPKFQSRIDKSSDCNRINCRNGFQFTGRRPSSRNASFCRSVGSVS